MKSERSWIFKSSNRTIGNKNKEIKGKSNIVLVSISNC